MTPEQTQELMRVMAKQHTLIVDLVNLLGEVPQYAYMMPSMRNRLQILADCIAKLRSADQSAEQV